MNWITRPRGFDAFTEEHPTAGLRGHRAPRCRLRHSSDSEPGSRARRAITGIFRWRGKAVTDRAEIDRLNAIALPPAYEHAWFCKDANGHLQATGIDARGRKQYRYHADFRAKRDTAKYDGLLEFGKRCRSSDGGSSRISSSVSWSRDGAAAVVRLLDTEHMRIGNEQYAKRNNSFGATTLRSRHLRRKGGKLTMRFVGKHGIVHEANISDTNLKRIVKRCQELPGQMLFQYVNGDGEPQPITSGDVNDYIPKAREASSRPSISGPGARA